MHSNKKHQSHHNRKAHSQKDNPKSKKPHNKHPETPSQSNHKPHQKHQKTNDDTNAKTHQKHPTPPSPPHQQSNKPNSPEQRPTNFQPQINALISEIRKAKESLKLALINYENNQQAYLQKQQHYISHHETLNQLLDNQRPNPAQIEESIYLSDKDITLTNSLLDFNPSDENSAQNLSFLEEQKEILDETISLYLDTESIHHQQIEKIEVKINETNKAIETQQEHIFSKVKNISRLKTSIGNLEQILRQITSHVQKNKETRLSLEQSLADLKEISVQSPPIEPYSQNTILNQHLEEVLHFEIEDNYSNSYANKLDEIIQKGQNIEKEYQNLIQHQNGIVSYQKEQIESLKLTISTLTKENQKIKDQFKKHQNELQIQANQYKSLFLAIENTQEKILNFNAELANLKEQTPQKIDINVTIVPFIDEQAILEIIKFIPYDKPTDESFTNLSKLISDSSKLIDNAKEINQQNQQTLDALTLKADNLKKGISLQKNKLVNLKSQISTLKTRLDGEITRFKKYQQQSIVAHKALIEAKARLLTKEPESSLAKTHTANKSLAEKPPENEAIAQITELSIEDCYRDDYIAEKETELTHCKGTLQSIMQTNKRLASKEHLVNDAIKEVEKRIVEIQTRLDNKKIEIEKEKQKLDGYENTFATLLEKIKDSSTLYQEQLTTLVSLKHNETTTNYQIPEVKLITLEPSTKNKLKNFTVQNIYGNDYYQTLVEELKQFRQFNQTNERFKQKLLSHINLIDDINKRLEKEINHCLVEKERNEIYDTHLSLLNDKDITTIELKEKLQKAPSFIIDEYICTDANINPRLPRDANKKTIFDIALEKNEPSIFDLAIEKNYDLMLEDAIDILFSYPPIKTNFLNPARIIKDDLDALFEHLNKRYSQSSECLKIYEWLLVHKKMDLNQNHLNQIFLAVQKMHQSSAALLVSQKLFDANTLFLTLNADAQQSLIKQLLDKNEKDDKTTRILKNWFSHENFEPHDSLTILYTATKNKEYAFSLYHQILLDKNYTKFQNKLSINFINEALFEYSFYLAKTHNNYQLINQLDKLSDKTHFQWKNKIQKFVYCDANKATIIINSFPAMYSFIDCLNVFNLPQNKAKFLNIANNLKPLPHLNATSNEYDKVMLAYYYAAISTLLQCPLEKNGNCINQVIYFGLKLKEVDYGLTDKAKALLQKHIKNQLLKTLQKNQNKRISPFNYDKESCKKLMGTHRLNKSFLCIPASFFPTRSSYTYQSLLSGHEITDKLMEHYNVENKEKNEIINQSPHCNW